MRGAPLRALFRPSKQGAFLREAARCPEGAFLSWAPVHPHGRTHADAHLIQPACSAWFLSASRLLNPKALPPPAPASHPASLWAAEAWCSGGTAELCGPGHWGGVAPRQHSLLGDSGAAALAESRGLQVVWLFWKLVPFRKLLDVTRQLSASLCWGNRQNVCPPAEGSHLSPFPHTWALSDLCLGSSGLEFGSAFWLKCLG